MLARLSIFLSETYGTFTDIIIPKSPTAQRITKNPVYLLNATHPAKPQDTSSISSIRSRLFYKVFDKKGSSKEWDEFIHTL